MAVVGGSQQHQKHFPQFPPISLPGGAVPQTLAEGAASSLLCLSSLCIWGQQAFKRLVIAWEANSPWAMYSIQNPAL